MDSKKKFFLEIFKRAESRYGRSKKRLAGEKWRMSWQVLIATIMSAQSRDESTIRIAEELFKKYKGLKALSMARYGDVLKILRSLNYNRTKAKHIIKSAKMIVEEFKGKVPDKIDDLVKLPGVGRKTANLVISEVYGKDGITVDTHVHRISNVLGLVHSKTPNQTERELKKITPRKYWSKINRIFVLWGKDVPGRDKERLMKALDK